MGTGSVTIIYLALAVIYFSLSLFLYRFSIRIKAAVREHNSAQLEDGLKNLKSYWKLAGILTVVVLSLYVLFFVFSILFGAAAFAGL
jgi:heme/copper-type cytochrome/quinol oxidase subunit 2